MSHPSAIQVLDAAANVDWPEEVTKSVEQLPSTPQSKATDWPDLIPFAVARPPRFPVEFLPGVVRDFVEAVALGTQTPPDLAGGLVLAIIGSTVARKVEIQARPGWIEPSNLYVLVVLPPGSRKSAVFVLCVAPVSEFEKLKNEELRPERARIVSLKKAREARIKNLETKAGRGEIDEAMMREIAKMRLEIEALPSTAPIVLIADDATPEQAATLTVQNDGRLGVMSPEGTFFGNIAGRYSEGRSNVELVLKGHSGDRLRVDRRERAEFVERPALTLALTAQPEVLQNIARAEGFRGRGFLARILYALPENTVGHREVCPPPVPDALRIAWKDLLWHLLRFEGNFDYPIRLVLSPEASDALADFERRLEPRLGENGDLFPIADWAGKLAGEVVRICGILHVAEYGLSERRVSAQTFRRAETFGEYFLAHARLAFDCMGVDADTSAARALARKLLSGLVPNPFDRREIQRRGWTGLSIRDAVAAACSELEERGWLRREFESTKGRPHERWFIHPQLVAQFRNRTDETDKSPLGESSVGLVSASPAFTQGAAGGEIYV